MTLGWCWAVKTPGPVGRAALSQATTRWRRQTARPPRSGSAGGLSAAGRLAALPPPGASETGDSGSGCHSSWPPERGRRRLLASPRFPRRRLLGLPPHPTPSTPRVEVPRTYVLGVGGGGAGRGGVGLLSSCPCRDCPLFFRSRVLPS